MAPKNLEQADEFKTSGKRRASRAQVQGQVGEGKADRPGPIKGHTAARPTPSAVAPSRSRRCRPTGQAPPADSAAAAPAKAGTPGADRPVQAERPDASTSEMATPSVTEAQLAKSNEPQFKEALEAKKGRRKHSAAAPDRLREQEAQNVSRRAGRKRGLGAAASGEMTASGYSSRQHVGNPQTTRNSDEEAREPGRQAGSRRSSTSTMNAPRWRIGSTRPRQSGRRPVRRAAPKEARARVQGRLDATDERLEDRRYIAGWGGSSSWGKDKLVRPARGSKPDLRRGRRPLRRADGRRSSPTSPTLIGRS